MLGVYENFPINVHRVIRLAATISNKTLQRTLVQCLEKLNSENLSLQKVTSPSTSDCTVAFEFGIADGDIFNYLESEEVQRVLKEIRRAPLQIMDFFCALRYYREQNGKKHPLKFDYYMLRLIFNKGSVEALVFHERGPRHVPPEDLVNLIIERVNQFYSRKVLKVV
ncbi:MAG: hypothetical protein QXN96_06070 [Candidatus Bathyarchaeia archaeon]